MEIHIQNRKKGFTLAELLVVVAIVAILAAISIPIFTRQLEASREATDLANVRSAYAEVMAAVMIEDTENEVKVVKLKQKKAKWQSHDPVTIGGVMHYNDQGDTANWIGYPVPGGECEVSYQPNSGVLFNWKGKNGTGGSEQKYTFNINCDMHAALITAAYWKCWVITTILKLIPTVQNPICFQRYRQRLRRTAC